MGFKTIYIPNGDELVPYHIYDCESCGDAVEEAWPREVIDNKVYCGDCAFKLGYINESEYIKRYCYWCGLPDVRACVKDGEIHLTTTKFPWERNSRNRECNDYKEWRKSVFTRDKFTCQYCNKTGGTLNAHHIKPYAKYEDLRYEVSNGITLCEDCHRSLHKGLIKLRKGCGNNGRKANVYQKDN